jgi:hypothetical protein
VTESGGAHPERLIWYACGRLDPGEARAIERHLAACSDCAVEVEALRSMARSIREQARTDHVATWDLIAHHDAGPRPSGDRARAIRGHLRECRECASDLAALGKAGRLERRLRRGRLPAAAAVAAAAVIVLAAAGAAGFRIARPAATEAPDLRPRQAVFAPVQRSARGERRLEGPGPWEVLVLLPYGAPAGPYRARIHRADGTAELIFEADVEPDAEGRLRLGVSRVSGPGRYVLSLRPRDGTGADPYLFGFDVVGAP